MADYRLKGAIVFVFVISVEVGAIELTSTVIYPDIGDTAIFQCMWNVSEGGSSLEVLSSDDSRYFLFYIDSFPHKYDTGLAASSRHSANSSASGFAWMTINDLQASDEGTYKCSILRLDKRTGKLETNVSNSYLNYTEFEIRKNSRPTTTTQRTTTVTRVPKITTSKIMTSRITTLAPADKSKTKKHVSRAPNSTTKNPGYKSSSHYSPPILTIITLTTMVVLLSTVIFFFLRRIKGSNFNDIYSESERTKVKASTVSVSDSDAVTDSTL